MQPDGTSFAKAHLAVVDTDATEGQSSTPATTYYSTQHLNRLLNNPNRANPPIQETSLDIWRDKYALFSPDGVAIDGDFEGTQRRVARALADVEPNNKEEWYSRFLIALKAGATPAGRITSNAGAGAYKPNTSLINCTVSGTIGDSMDDILNKVHEAGMTLKAGCGIGYEFSTLRPRGASVTGVGSQTSGPLSFMEIYDKMCNTISSAGGRRGAQMGTFDVNHPDVEEFIQAKRQDGMLRQFNLSLLVTREFMDAVENDGDWHLNFPLSKKEAGRGIGTIERFMPWFPNQEDYHQTPDGKLVCDIYKTVKARDLWDNYIMKSTYNFAEPGFILIDEVNDMNNNWYCEEIRATNPCGEQPLPPYGSCLLGSINLVGFVRDPFTPQAQFDWAAYCETVRIFTRMLDNVVEINGLPLENQVRELVTKRRHGMGYLGLGSAMAMLGYKYGDEDSVDFTEQVSYLMAVVGFQTGVDLAIEKGPAPIMEQEFEVTQKLVNKKPALLTEYKLGDKVKGKRLALYSNYLAKFSTTEEGRRMLERFAEHGCRFTHHSSIAPTGTISLSLGNNASNGIEPSFSHHYFRNVIVPGKKTKEKRSVYSYELLAYREFEQAQGIHREEDDVSNLPRSFATTDDLIPENHVDIQAAAQKWVDSSISKTCNVPTDISFEAFKNVYIYAANSGLKGCTTFRYNPEAFQGVLVKADDLKSTNYEFALEDGTTVVYSGDTMLEYEGNLTTAANLFDALKEGYYGKF